MNKIDEKFNEAVEKYPWDSEDQKQGYLALVHYHRKVGLSPPFPEPTACFFIQKDLDATEWWREAVGTQISDLQEQIRLLLLEMKSLKEKLNEH